MLIPETETDLLGLAEQMTRAVEDIGATIGLPADTGPTLRAERARVDAAKAAHDAAHNALRMAQATRRAAMAAGQRAIKNGTHVLRPRLGSTFNPAWRDLVTEARSLAIPENSAEIIARLEALERYFSDNPSHETPGVGVTATEMQTAAVALREASRAVTTAKVSLRNASQTRKATLRILGCRLRGVGANLSALLEADDNRWRIFGMQRPVDKRRPQPPEPPTVTQTIPGNVEVRISKATRAKRYRVWVSQPGDAEPKCTATVRNPFAVLKELPTGVPIQVTVSAANKSGESPRSEPVEILLETPDRESEQGREPLPLALGVDHGGTGVFDEVTVKMLGETTTNQTGSRST